MVFIKMLSACFITLIFMWCKDQYLKPGLNKASPYLKETYFGNWSDQWTEQFIGFIENTSKLIAENKEKISFDSLLSNSLVKHSNSLI